MSAVQAASIALAAGLFKFAASKIGPPITSEFACIKGVTKDLSLLQDIHGEISSWLQRVHGGAIDSDPSFRWVLKLQNVADDICELLHEVHLEAERNKTGPGGEKYYAIADCLTAKPKSFMYRCKIAHRIKAIKVRYASIVKQRSDAKAVLTSCGVSNMRAGEEHLLTDAEVAEILQSEQNHDITFEPLESHEGDDDWIVVTKNQDQSVSPRLAGGMEHHSLEQDFVDDELQPVEVALQEFLPSDVAGTTATGQDTIAALTAIFNLEDVDAQDFGDAVAAVAGDGIADLQDGALNLQAEALQAAA